MKFLVLALVAQTRAGAGS